MEPLIPDGALCLSPVVIPPAHVRGVLCLSKTDVLWILIQAARFSVKSYRRVTEVTDEQSREGVLVHLLPENQNYMPIVLANVTEGRCGCCGVIVSGLPNS